MRMCAGRNITAPQQSGAAEACWAHNPEVDGSKPSTARKYLLFPYHRFFFPAALALLLTEPAR